MQGCELDCTGAADPIRFGAIRSEAERTTRTTPAADRRVTTNSSEPRRDRPALTIRHCSPVRACRQLSTTPPTTTSAPLRCPLRPSATMSRIARSALQHARRAMVAPSAMTRVAACRPAVSMVHTRLAQQWTPIRCFLSPPGDKSGMISTQPSPDGKGTIPVVLVPDAKKIWKDVSEGRQMDDCWCCGRGDRCR